MNFLDFFLYLALLPFAALLVFIYYIYLILIFFCLIFASIFDSIFNSNSIILNNIIVQGIIKTIKFIYMWLFLMLGFLPAIIGPLVYETPIIGPPLAVIFNSPYFVYKFLKGLPTSLFLLFILCSCLFYLSTIKRLNHLRLSWDLSFLIFVPFLNMLFLGFLLIKKSDNT